MSRVHAAALAFVALFSCSAAVAQVQRTFVASTGNDANTATNCGFAAPCRSFTAAQTVTQSGGEVIALDAAGYGAITISKSLSILANPGAYAGISASSGNAVTIATADVNVRLSGLRINGIGATNGILMTDGDSLTIDNCTISGFSGNGITVVAPAAVRVINTLVMNNSFDGMQFDGGATANVVNSMAMGNLRAGILAQATSAVTTSVAVTGSVASGSLGGIGSYSTFVGGTATVTASNSSADHNSYGFLAQNAGTAAVVSVSSSKATRNDTGFANVGGATFNSAGNNMVIENGLNSSGAITNVGTM